MMLCNKVHSIRAFKLKFLFCEMQERLALLRSVDEAKDAALKTQTDLNATATRLRHIEVPTYLPTYLPTCLPFSTYPGR